MKEIGYGGGNQVSPVIQRLVADLKEESERLMRFGLPIAEASGKIRRILFFSVFAAIRERVDAKRVQQLLEIMRPVEPFLEQHLNEADDVEKATRTRARIAELLASLRQRVTEQTADDSVAR